MISIFSTGAPSFTCPHDRYLAESRLQDGVVRMRLLLIALLVFSTMISTGCSGSEDTTAPDTSETQQEQQDTATDEQEQQDITTTDDEQTDDIKRDPLDLYQVPSYDEFNVSSHDTTLVCVKGTLDSINPTGDLRVVDEDGHEWFVIPSFGDSFNFEKYIGTDIAAFGRCAGKGIHIGPEVWVMSGDDCIKLNDGVVYDSSFDCAESDPSSETSDSPAPSASDTTTPSPQPVEQHENKTDYVWIPQDGGSKYHRNAGCSGMKNPKQVTRQEAESLGFTPCKRCM